jgi:hypothetical protein
MAPIRPKPLINGAVSIYNWVPDQTFVSNKVVPPVQSGHGVVNAPGITHQQTITANVHYFVSAHNIK